MNIKEYVATSTVRVLNFFYSMLWVFGWCSHKWPKFVTLNSEIQPITPSFLCPLRTVPFRAAWTLFRPQLMRKRQSFTRPKPPKRFTSMNLVGFFLSEFQLLDSTKVEKKKNGKECFPPPRPKPLSLEFAMDFGFSLFCSKCISFARKEMWKKRFRCCTNWQCCAIYKSILFDGVWRMHHLLAT